MSHFYDIPLAGPAELAGLTATLGPGAYGRLIGYLVEDGPRAIAGIEHALAHGLAAAMIGPAHRLKGDAAQLGALRLAALAEFIEVEARDCVEERRTPEALQGEVAMLRACFQQSLAALTAMNRVSRSAADETLAAAVHVPPAEPAGVRGGTPASHAGARPSFGRRASP